VQVRKVRNDVIENGLFETPGRHRVDKVDSQHGGFALNSTTRKDHILQPALDSIT